MLFLLITDNKNDKLTQNWKYFYVILDIHTWLETKAQDILGNLSIEVSETDASLLHIETNLDRLQIPRRKI